MQAGFSSPDIISPMKHWWTVLRARAEALEKEARVLVLAYRHPRTPWYARVLAVLVLAHTFSPVDLIPDFIPVLGLLDDWIITPLGIALVIRMIPPEVMAEARQQAEGRGGIDPSLRRLGVALVIVLWLVVLLWLGKAIWEWMKK